MDSTEVKLIKNKFRLWVRAVGKSQLFCTEELSEHCYGLMTTAMLISAGFDNKFDDVIKLVEDIDSTESEVFNKAKHYLNDVRTLIMEKQNANTSTCSVEESNEQEGHCNYNGTAR